jgi:hypothetical protein
VITKEKYKKEETIKERKEKRKENHPSGRNLGQVVLLSVQG